METGHLDRIVQGHNAEEILTACDEHTISVNVGDAVGSNAALHFFRFVIVRQKKSELKVFSTMYYFFLLIPEVYDTEIWLLSNLLLKVVLVKFKENKVQLIKSRTKAELFLL